MARNYNKESYYMRANKRNLFFIICNFLLIVSCKDLTNNDIAPDPIKVPEFPNFYADQAMYSSDGKMIIFERRLPGESFQLCMLHEDSSEVYSFGGISFFPNDISSNDSLLIGNTNLADGRIVKFNLHTRELNYLAGRGTQNNLYGSNSTEQFPIFSYDGSKILHTMRSNLLIGLRRGIIEMNLDGSGWKEILRSDTTIVYNPVEITKLGNKQGYAAIYNYRDEDNNSILELYKYDENLNYVDNIKFTELLKKNKIEGYPTYYQVNDNNILLSSNLYETYVLDLESEKASLFLELEPYYYINELPRQHPVKKHVYLMVISYGYESSIFEYDAQEKVLTNIFNK
ncbi:hypothetical protein EP331_09870 [bacterium]|nr:MAG: hypothetical protein EP331_09870 [bacterium]